MEKAIVGKKLGMTQVFNPAGLMIPVTVVEAGPVTVLRVKTQERDGYDALVVGFGAAREGDLNKPEAGAFKKAGVAVKAVTRELRFADCSKYKVGQDITCEIFADGDVVDVIGTSKGHGFSGAIKRWNQHRLKMTHGTGPVHRERGSMGAHSDPSRVIKGLHMPGHFGQDGVTMQNLTVVKVDKARNVLLIKGALPGPNGGLVTVKQAVKKSK